MSLLAAIPPTLTKTFKAKVVKPGITAMMECSATGDPLPSIEWLVRSKEVRPSNRIRMNTINSDSETIVTSKLTITNVITKDGGVYTCSASNKVGTAIHSDALHVYGLPFVWPIKNTTAISGSTVVIDCHVSGYPIKTISWKKGIKFFILADVQGVTRE